MEAVQFLSSHSVFFTNTLHDMFLTGLSGHKDRVKHNLMINVGLKLLIRPCG